MNGQMFYDVENIGICVRKKWYKRGGEKNKKDTLKRSDFFFRF